MSDLCHIFGFDHTTNHTVRGDCVKVIISKHDHDCKF